MFFKILIRYMWGYINIKVEGYFVEKFVNKCINENIFFWNVKREKSTIAYMNVGIKDFKKLCRISKEVKCKVNVLEKKGLPFFLHRYRKRKILVILIILIILVLFIASKFIWKVEIVGLNNIDAREITSLLEQKVIKVGSLRNIVQGTNAIIKIVESDSKPEVINEEEYCNIVATKDAQIVKISAQNGIPVVKTDDIVTKGDILIAGWIEGKYTGTRYVHAEGEVKAKVWYTEKEQVPLNQVVEKNTGNLEKKYKIKINNFTINLFKTLSKFKKYDTIETCNQIKIFSNFYLPINLIQITNVEKEEEKITYGIEDAKQIGIRKASEKIEKQLNNDQEVLQKYVNTYANNDSIVTEVTYEVLENIGTKEKIVF